MKSEKEEKEIELENEIIERKKMLKFQKKAFAKIIKELNKENEKHENPKDLEKNK